MLQTKMYFCLFLMLVPLVTCHYQDNYVHQREGQTFNNKDNEPYRGNMDYTDGKDYQDNNYATNYDNTAHERNMMNIRNKGSQEIKSTVQSKPAETTVNLKVSGHIELVKSYKDMNLRPRHRWMHGHRPHPPWMHGHPPPPPGMHEHPPPPPRMQGPPHPGPWYDGGYWWMKKHMHGRFGKKMWLKHAMDFHQHLHDLMDKQKEEDVEDEDDEDEDEDEEDFFDAEETKMHARLNCPIWITTQFLKLCKCRKINDRVERVLGHPLKEFPKDPMQLFNNTPGMAELDRGDVKGLMSMIPGLKPNDLSQLFFAGMIKSMCANAKSYIKRVEIFEKTLRAREKAVLAKPPTRDSGESENHPGRPYETVSPGVTEKPRSM